MKPRTILTASITFLVLAVLIMAIPVGAATVPDENKPEFWCGDNGVKIEPVDTPFIVPAPAEGTTWTLIVLKGGTTNETHSSPLQGDSFSHSLHENSHVILCYETLTTTTTLPPTTTTLPATTSTSTTEPPTTTSQPATTTTVPETTTSSSTTTTVVDPTTTTQLETTTTVPLTTTTTSQPSTSTVPPDSTTTTPTDTSTTTTTLDPGTTTTSLLPNTGASNVIPFGIAGIGLLLLGSLSLLGAWAYGYGRDDR